MTRIMITLCLAALMAGCATQSEEEPQPEPTPVVQSAEAPPAQPPAAPAREAQPEATLVAEPMLPETAGQLPLIGLAGAGALALAGGLHTLRRYIA